MTQVQGTRSLSEGELSLIGGEEDDEDDEDDEITAEDVAPFTDVSEETPADDEKPEADVVSLDSFRK